MANLGNDFRTMVEAYINSWNEPLEIINEVNVGLRFVNTTRRLDLVIRNQKNNKYMAIECKAQFTPGTAYEKLSYALDDCIASPIPTILVFSGSFIKDDIKSKLIMSGIGIEVESIIENNQIKKIIDHNNILRQRCYIELGLNWFPFATGQRIDEQLKKLGYNNCND
jgi:hypothetical protein